MYAVLSRNQSYYANLSNGDTGVETSFYIFNEGEIAMTVVVPAFSGAIQVTLTVGASPTISTISRTPAVLSNSATEGKEEVNTDCHVYVTNDFSGVG